MKFQVIQEKLLEWDLQISLRLFVWFVLMRKYIKPHLLKCSGKYRKYLNEKLRHFTLGLPMDVLKPMPSIWAELTETDMDLRFTMEYFLIMNHHEEAKNSLVRK